MQRTLSYINYVNRVAVVFQDIFTRIPNRMVYLPTHRRGQTPENSQNKFNPFIFCLKYVSNHFNPTIKRLQCVRHLFNTLYS